MLNPCWQWSSTSIAWNTNGVERYPSSAYFLLCKQQILRYLDPPEDAFPWVYIFQFTDFLLSFLYSEHCLSFSNLFQCSSFSCCPRFFSFLHQYVAQHNPSLLRNKMASTHRNINCFQNTTTPVRFPGVIRACDITRSILIRKWDLGNSQNSYGLNNFPINANLFTGVTAVLFYLSINLDLAGKDC